MSQFYVVGGRQKSLKDIESVPEWHHYEAAVVVKADMGAGTLEPVLEYVSPPDVCASMDNASILFKTGTVVDSQLYVPTQTELLVYRLPEFELQRYVSLPHLNDVHHVRPGRDGTLLVANTGLDMVMEVGADDRVANVWNVLGENPWARFSPDVDYRKVVSTKPHRSHPNHVWFLEDELWVTRCNQHDALCLTRDREPIPLGDAWVHDGLVRGGRIYFTSVNGFVIVVDAASKQVVGRYDLNAIAGGGPPLGWCRGIEVIEEDRVVVGFSRLRPTRWKENVRWVKHRFGGGGVGLKPTRLLTFDLAARTVEQEVNLEPGGLNVVFSIHAALD